MRTFNHKVGCITVLLLCIFQSAAFSGSITAFQFTQPNFTGGGGNSLFDVAVVEERGGGEYLENQGKNLELTVQENAVDLERKKVGLENDKVILGINELALETDKMQLESARGVSQQSASSASQTPEEEPESRETHITITNSGNLTFENYEDTVTSQIETGEYILNDVDTADGTGYIEQNPESYTNVLVESGN